MPTYDSSIDQYRVPLSEKDLPKKVLSRLVSYNIVDVERFLDLARIEFHILRKMLGISSLELEKYVSHVRSNHPEISALESDNDYSWKAPPPGVVLDDSDSYDTWTRKSMDDYNRRNRF